MENLKVKIEPVRDGKDAIVVIVHDDGDRDTCKFLLGELEKEDLSATIAMVSNRFMDVATGELNTEAVTFWQSLLDTGRFSLSSHSRTHRFWGMTDEEESGIRIDNGGNELPYSLAAGEITREVVGSRDDMRRAFPSQRMLTFVKPGFGRHSSGVQVSEKAYEIIRSAYIGMRNTGGGVSPIPTPDVYNIKSYMVRAGESDANWTPYVDRAINEGGMIVFLFHGIFEEGSGISVARRDVSPFLAYVGQKKREGKIWCTSLEEATLYTEELRASSVEAYLKDDEISISLLSPLDPSVYNTPLTVSVTLPCDWEKVSTDDGQTPAIHQRKGESFVYLSLSPASPIATLKKEV